AGVFIEYGGTLVTTPSSLTQGGLSFDTNSMFGVAAVYTAATIIHQGIIDGGVHMADFANSVTLFVGSSIINGDLNLGTSSAATLTLDGAGTQSFAAAVDRHTHFQGTLIKQGAGTWNLDQA